MTALDLCPPCDELACFDCTGTVRDADGYFVGVCPCWASGHESEDE